VSRESMRRFREKQRGGRPPSKGGRPQAPQKIIQFFFDVKITGRGALESGNRRNRVRKRLAVSITVFER